MNSFEKECTSSLLRCLLGLSVDATPFPWQERLLRLFIQGSIPRSLDIPTGLGKTSVMAIWLLARGSGAQLPRRLVYVVDRRAVVDQASTVALQIRESLENMTELKSALGLGDQTLPISTLRGQHVDNKEWLDNPATSAIIVGTIDMIGSRLLFEGYRVSRKMRPYHAGLLGADTLIVLDEAHLVPPFEKLIETISRDRKRYGPAEERLRSIIPELKLLSLSATGRGHSENTFELENADLEHRVLKHRMEARKRLKLVDLEQGKKLEVALAEKAWNLSDKGTRPIRCIIFTDRRKTAAATKQIIEKLAKEESGSKGNVDTELFVGGRRVFEREEATKCLETLGFIAGKKVDARRPTFVCATSAGEVGVDLDADHMVSDLVAWERMVQRLGRVNRRGDGDAEVIVIAEPASKDAEKALGKLREGKDLAPNEVTTLEVFGLMEAVQQVVNSLPQVEGDAKNASLEALRHLRIKATADDEFMKLIGDSTTPEPLRPAINRPLVDAWSMTSLKEHTGRPEVGPWLRGWIKDDPPQTTVIWRKHLPVRTTGPNVSAHEIEMFFEAARPHASEALETDTHRVVKWLFARAKAISEKATQREGTQTESDVAAFVLSNSGDLRLSLTLKKLVAKDSDQKELKDSLFASMAGATLVVDARTGGLVAGLLDPKETRAPRAADDGMPWLVDPSCTSPEPPPLRFRIRSVEAGQVQPGDSSWRERFRFVTELSKDGQTSRWLIIEKWGHDAETEEDRSTGKPQRLDEHQKCVEERARHLANQLTLPKEYEEMLALAARLHDEGKRLGRWQRAFNAPSDGFYAKTRGPVNHALLDGYRHEFGSIPLAKADSCFLQLGEDLKDLALHLIAAHHGFARPSIATDNCEDAPPSRLEWRARDVALRFARLQKRWGPWGLAWWEAILRAADQQASRINDSAGPTTTQEVGR